MLQEEENGPLTELQTKLKERGVKAIDLGQIANEALATIDKEWWANKLDELTPLEYKLHAALENPETRQKLMSILDGK